MLLDTLIFNHYLLLNAACSPDVAGSAVRWAALVTAALLTILMLPSVMWRNRLLSRVQSCLRMRTSSHTLLPLVPQID